jgi:hypothetical protein
MRDRDSSIHRRDTPDPPRRPQRAGGVENYIPLRKAALRKLLLDDPILTHQQREQMGQLCRLLEATIHHDYHERLERLKDLYHPFDPDANPQGRESLSNKQSETADDFFDALMDLVDRANFRQLIHEQIVEALDQASAFGVNLDVDFSVFKRLEIFARGSSTIRRSLPGYWNSWRKRTIEIPVYQRLVIAFQLREHKRLGPQADTKTIHVKIFKDIPKCDLDMLLPGTRVKISLVDQGKIILPTLSGVALTLVKIIKGALLVTFAGVYGLLALLGLVGGTIGYGIRSFFAYANTKDKYHLSLTRSLYFQNLGNNEGVLFRLLDEAEEQDFREAMLAYFLLWKHAGAQGWSVEHLDLAAEQFLLDHAGVQVDFEISDALDKLVVMKLVSPVAGGKWRAVELDEALAVLDAAWDGIFHAEQTRRTLQVPHFHRAGPPEFPLDSNDWGPVL